MGSFILREDIIPKDDELLYLYNNVGWKLYTEKIDILIKSIENSLKVITAFDNGKLIALIRVVGDGYSIIYIQDILVLQKYQNQGIGKILIEEIMNRYKNVRQKVLLTDNKSENISFYKKVGFSKSENLNCVAFVKLK
ncbi:MAG: GNAT family N-acetyltransferase [Sarcina sp.]